MYTKDIKSVVNNQDGISKYVVSSNKLVTLQISSKNIILNQIFLHAHVIPIFLINLEKVIIFANLYIHIYIQTH